MIGYVAKDKRGEIYLHTEEPAYNDELECWLANTIEMLNITGQCPEFDNMSYKDEPIKVEIKLERI